MAKKTKLYGDRWAVCKMDGKIGRDKIGHRAAVYSTRKTAKEMLESYEVVPGGVKIVDLHR